MTISHEQTLETPKINPGEFDLAEHYKDIEAKAERRLDAPQLNDVLNAAVAEGILEKDVYDRLQETEGDERYQLQEEVFRNLNPRDPSKGFNERARLDKTLPEKFKKALESENFQKATMAAAEALEMTKPQKLPEGHYKLFVAHGGINRTPLLRVTEGLDTFMYQEEESGERSAEIGVAAGTDRPVSDGEKEKAADYIANYTRKDKIKHEADLMDAAVEHWLREHDLEDIIEQSDMLFGGTAQGETVSGMPYWIRLYDLQAAKAEGRLPATMPNVLASINAPMDATRLIRRGIKTAYKDRADTEDPLEMIHQIVDLEPGDLVGSFSHHPVSKAQLLTTQEVLFEAGVEVKEGAYKSDALINQPGTRFSEVCKVVSGSERLRQHAQEKLATL